MGDFNETHAIDQEFVTGGSNKYLTLFLNDQCYGIPISQVIEIIGMQSVASVPEFPDYAKGIINLRGLIVPLIDINMRLGYEQKEYTEKTCVIVVNVLGVEIGLIVDEVDEVLDINSVNVNPPSKNSSNNEDYISGIAVLPEKMILLLSCEKIIGAEYF